MTSTTDRRRRRATSISGALNLQLSACCEEGEIDAMVLADLDGLPLAASGDSFACDEVAASMVKVGSKVPAFSGTLYGPGHRWEVQMQKVEIAGTELLVCAVGGTDAARRRQLSRGAAGAARILAV